MTIVNRPQNTYLLDDFLDQYHQWILNGKGFSLAARELRYYLDQQKKRISSKGLSYEEEYVELPDAIYGSISKKSSTYKASVVYRETKRILTFKENDKTVKQYKQPVTFYGTLLQKDGFTDREYVCPNCGHKSFLSELTDGCPYCGTNFETDDIYPCFTSFYNVNGIVERASLMDKLKKRLLIIGIGCGILFFILSFITYADYQLWFRIIISLFMGAFIGGMSAFLSYMAYSIFLLFKVFKEAGRSLPLLSGIKTGNKIQNKIKDLDPDFSFEYFEGRIISLFKAIAFVQDREDLCIYTGDEDLSYLDDVIDIQYRGALQLKSVDIHDDVIRIQLKAFMTDTYKKQSIYQKDENFLLTLEKEKDSSEDPGLNILKIQCPNCGGSFDALHLKNCPHCDTPYDLKKNDWVITGIRKL